MKRQPHSLFNMHVFLGVLSLQLFLEEDKGLHEIRVAQQSPETEKAYKACVCFEIYNLRSCSITS